MRRGIVGAAVVVVLGALWLVDGPIGTLYAPSGVEPAVRKAIGRLHSWRGSTRAAAADELTILGAAGAPAAATLVDHLDDFSWADAGEGLSKMFTFHGGPSLVYLHAAKALAAIGPGAVPALVDGMASSRWQVRFGAVDVLAGIHDARALPALRAAVTGEDNESVQNAAARALGRLGDRAVLADVIRRLHDTDPRRRSMAILLLESLKAPELESLLRECLQDADSNVRTSADAVLRRNRRAGR